MTIIVVWMLAKNLLKRKTKDREKIDQENLDVEDWYSKVQDKIADMDVVLRREREASWAGLSDKEKLNISEVFMQSTFGARDIRKYAFEEKLKIGKMYFLTQE